MAACLDTFKWNNTELFKHLHNVLPKDFTESHNILEVKDDLLFVWNEVEYCLLALNWRAVMTKGNSIKFQKLIMSSTSSSAATAAGTHHNNKSNGDHSVLQKGLSCPVKRILPSNDGSLMCVMGARGVAVMELPGRWGPNGLYREGSETIFCRTTNLDDKLFMVNSNLEVLSVKWHPASPNHSNLLVLLSDNSIRVYNEMKLRHVWRLGGQLDNHSRYSIDFGETAVDFDFGAPRFVQQQPQCVLLDDSQPGASGNRRIEWPIYVLKGNGSVDVLSAGIDTARPTVYKDVTIFPAKKDNYGVDSCSIIAIQSSPTVLVIAESTGKLHHCVIIESTAGDSETGGLDNSQLNETVAVGSPKWTMYVLETIELELGLSIDPKEKNYVCQIFMKRDPTNENRYFAYHDAGLHAISIKFLETMSTFMDLPDADDVAPQFQEASHAEYLVCTKVQGSERMNAVLGLAFLQSPPILVLYLNSGQVVSQDLITDNQLLDQYLQKPTVTIMSGKYLQTSPGNLLNQSIEKQVASILSKKTTQPLLNLDKSTALEPLQNMELLQRTIGSLRENYFSRLTQVRQELERRVQILRVLKEQQVAEIKNLQCERELIRENAENLAVKYEDICEKQQHLSKRAQEVVRLANLLLPKNTNGEKEYVEQVNSINSKAKALTSQLSSVRTRMEQFKKQSEAAINGTPGKAKMATMVLPPNREKIIREILGDGTKQIEQQVKDVKKLLQIINAQ